MFTDDAIEVCIKKFVHFLRKGFIKIITNISCLKPGETRLKDSKHRKQRGVQPTDAKYTKPQEEAPPTTAPLCSYPNNWTRCERRVMWYWLFDLNLPPLVFERII